MRENVTDLLTGKVCPPPEKDCTLLGENTVVSHCKREGVMLIVEGVAQGKPRLKGEGERTDPRHGPLVRLWRAFTRDDINYIAPTDPGISEMKSNILVPEPDVAAMNAKLSDDRNDIRRLSTWPIVRTFVYVDVSDFSQHRPGEQALIVGTLSSLVQNWRYWNRGFALDAWKDLEAQLCIGDGYIYVFRDVVCATFFAAYFAELIEARVARKLLPVQFHFRMGVHVGPVYCFWDYGRGGGTDFFQDRIDPAVKRDGELERTEAGDWNYIGEGINGGQRVLAAVGKETDDILFISDRVRQALTATDDGNVPARKLLNSLINRGRRLDKHNKSWRVYEVSHTVLCGGDIASDALV